MNRVSQKSQYALRTILDLARHLQSGPVSIREISERQAIPYRFLELIARDLRQQGIILSHRGARGGYELLVDPSELTVGRIMQLFDGPIRAVDCDKCGGDRSCTLRGQCALSDLWKQAQETIQTFYESTTIEDLLENRPCTSPAANYCI